MAEASKSLNVFVTGGAEGAGLATVKVLRRRGHNVVATACDAAGALALRLADALPVYPDLARASEVLSVLALAKADAVVHAGPQVCGGLPQASLEYRAFADTLLDYTRAVVEATEKHGVQRIVSLSYAYLYDAGHGAAKEGDHEVHDSEYAPMLAAEATVRGSSLNGYILRAGYIYGGNSAGTNALADDIKQSQRLPAGAEAASWIHEDDLAAAIVCLLEADAELSGIETLNAAGDTAASPNDFASATCGALGLNAPSFAGKGFLSMLQQKTFRDNLLEREIVINSDRLRNDYGWQPLHDSIESGLDATALVWRMNDAVDNDDYYNAYDDSAAEAIAAFAYDVALPEPVAEAESPEVEQVAAAPVETPVQAATPPPSDGPTPWNEDEAKREERRRKALERKAKRAARQAGG